MTRTATSLRAAGRRFGRAILVLAAGAVFPGSGTTAAVAVLAPVAVLVHVAVLVPGCGGGLSDEPGSAEELVETIFRETAAGNQDRIWELLSTEHRAEFELFVQRDREFIRRNPGNDNKADMYSMPLQEFLSAPIRQVWVRANTPGNHLFQGARITARFADPQRPTDAVFDVENPRGQKWRLVVRPEGSRWRLQRTIPLQLDIR
jgi:hypothetical protein